MELTLNDLQTPPLSLAAPRLAPRALMHLGAWLLAAALTGCASAPKTAPGPAPAPPQPTLTELMQDAQSAVQAGTPERARQALRDAAKAYPTAKEPWVKLAADYFESLDYGNAILAAQEVTQRDPMDGTAHSILAVSGLRVSSSALATLRAQQAGMPSDTRTEAQNLTRVLRETLGEQVLVPRTDTPPVAAAPTRRGARNAAKANPPPAAPLPTSATAQAKAPGVAPPAPAPGKAVAPAPAAPVTATSTPNATTAPTAAKPVPPVAAKPSTPPAANKPAANPFDILR